MAEDKLIKLKSFYKRHRRLPSYSEMLKIFGFASKKAVHTVIHKLIEAGFLKKENNKLAPTVHFFSLPLYGIIKAGFPVISDENKQYVSLEDYLIEDPNESFLLKVSGDSLQGVGIFDGDMVIIERAKSATPGDIVLAEIDKEWTLKILKRDRAQKITYLISANPKYPPFYPRQELQIHGIVKAVIRKFTSIH